MCYQVFAGVRILQCSELILFNDNLTHNYFLYMFISILYMFRAFKCSSSGSGVPRNFVLVGSTNSVDDRGQRERGSGGGSPLDRGSGNRCNLVQEISFHIVKFSQFLVL